MVLLQVQHRDRVSMGFLSAFVGLLLLAVAKGQSTSFYEASVENFQLVNDFRTSEGAQTLEWDDELYELALSWSKHMFEVSQLYHSDYGMAENVAMA